MRTSRPPRRALALAGAALLTTVLTACSSSGTDHDTAGTNHASTAAASPSTGGGTSMPGMDHGMPGAANAGAPADNHAGYRLTAVDTALPAGRASAYRFGITGPDGKPVTAFSVEQTERMHFYAVRSDLTGFQHLHPTMAADGTWTAPLAALTPGTWRTYASFTPDSGDGKGTALVLSRTVSVDGGADAVQLPPPSTSTQVDGYTVTVQGAPMANMAHPVTVTITEDGKPVTDLQPYLDTYAHLTAFHEGDMAFAHLHPENAAVNGGLGGPDLAFHAEFPRAGNWRLFLQFRTAGRLHTAAITLKVG